MDITKEKFTKGNIRMKKFLIAVSLIITLIAGNCTPVFANNGSEAGHKGGHEHYKQEINISIDGYKIEAENAETFIREGFSEDISTEAISWTINAVELEDKNISLKIDAAKAHIKVSGELYLGYDQTKGYNYVAALEDKDFSTLYFSICENMESKNLFSKEEMNGLGLVWYLYDSNGDLLVFEKCLQEDLIPIEVLEANITEIAEGEIDTLWFVYKTEAVESYVIPAENMPQTMTSLYGGDTKYIGDLYTDTFYLAGVEVTTLCRPYAELTSYADTGNNYESKEWITNLAMHQRVYSNGVDITGSVSEVFKLSNISYKVGVVGNAIITSHTISGTVYEDNFFGSASKNATIKLIRTIAPKKLTIVNDLITIFATIMTIGDEVSISATNTLSCTAFGVAVNSKQYIAKDTELYGQFVGCKFGVRTQDTTATRDTTAAVKIQYEYTVEGANTCVQVTDAVIIKEFKANK